MHTRTRHHLPAAHPRMLLPAILGLVASDTDPISRQNLKVDAMPLCQAPRRRVRHGGVGPGTSFHEALCALSPGIDRLSTSPNQSG